MLAPVPKPPTGGPGAPGPCGGPRPGRPGASSSEPARISYCCPPAPYCSTARGTAARRLHSRCTERAGLGSGSGGRRQRAGSGLGCSVGAHMRHATPCSTCGQIRSLACTTSALRCPQSTAPSCVVAPAAAPMGCCPCGHTAGEQGRGAACISCWRHWCRCDRGTAWAAAQRPWKQAAPTECATRGHSGAVRSRR